MPEYAVVERENGVARGYPIHHKTFADLMDYCNRRIDELKEMRGRFLFELALFEVSLGVYTMVDKIVLNRLGLTPEHVKEFYERLQG